MIKTTTYNQINEKKTISRMLMGIMLALFLYIFFIGVISISAAQMEEAKSQIRTLGSEVSELELEYVSLGRGITLSYAHSIGFDEPEDILFVTEKTFAVRY